MPPWTDWMFHPPSSPGRPHQWLGSWELDDDDRCWLAPFPRSVLFCLGGREGPGLSAGSPQGRVRCSSPSDCKLGIGWRLYLDNNRSDQTSSSPELNWIHFCKIHPYVLSPFQDMLSSLFWFRNYIRILIGVIKFYFLIHSQKFIQAVIKWRQLLARTNLASLFHGLTSGRNYHNMAQSWLVDVSHLRVW